MTAKKTEPKVTITADAILKALEQGAKSLTGLAKLIGYKSGSSSVLKKLIQVVPDIEARLAINAPAKDSPIKDNASEAKPKLVKAGKVGKKTAKVPADKKPAEKKSMGKAEYPMPECVPYRASSGYAMVWAILYAHREKGISKADLISAYKKMSQKADANCGYDVHVVISPREDGSCHRSAGKASQSYWVEREGDFLKLHIIGEKK